MRDVLHRSLESVRFKAQEKKIKLELCPPPTTDTRVVGDPYRLTQILLNLLGNAIKFTVQGQITLRCERLSPLHAPPRFAFTVQDTGIGIPAPQLRHIFEAFTQASASTAREYGGTGLGLSISKGLVELLGGTITVESQVHQGSAFRVELPFRQPDAFSPAASSTPTAAHPPLGPYRILLAEDNEVNQFLTQKLLRNWGLVVDTALNGKQAVQLFQQHAYALVLMDIQMPTMDGPTATRLLQRHPDAQRAATPVIALTAHAFSDEEQRYCQAGFVGYLSKPFREEQLYAVLTRFLTAAANLPTEPPLFNLTALQQIAQGDDDFVRNMVQLFNETVPPAIDKMERHAAQQEWQRLSEMAHHLKSTFSSLHITAVQDALRQLELITSSPLEPELVAALVQHIRQVAAAVMKQLKTQL
ncbi:hypothetical protein PK28_00115 [Hymenobacter sp. DG25B]|uniref:ATP-binding protein n=1 Tax=Hymenobacter sp. DG25B TaxID=1385664 RepID=UPI0005407642|nr:ATP-binding protein [Hymenobacter sp. DG25B]AIZ62495.1 hypothetical protein PK28_00115 [Hymenobacter sp. DG25B]